MYVVYFISDGSGHIKIGITNEKDRRIKELGTGNPNKLTYVHTIECASKQDASALEIEYHNALAPLRQTDGTGKEWFNLEWEERFKDKNELLDFVKSKQQQKAKQFAKNNPIFESGDSTKDACSIENYGKNYNNISWTLKEISNYIADKEQIIRELDIENKCLKQENITLKNTIYNNQIMSYLEKISLRINEIEHQIGWYSSEFGYLDRKLKNINTNLKIIEGQTKKCQT